MKSIQQLLHRHFNGEKRKNILYFETKTPYEAQLLELPHNFYKIATSELNCYGSIGFDLVLSQGIQQIQEGERLSRVLHCPHIHLETELFPGDENLKNLTANRIISSWDSVANTWGRNDVILPWVEVKANTLTREGGCLYLDVDEQMSQLGMVIAGKYPVKQLKIEDNDFSKVSILVSLVQDPNHKQRLITAASQGVLVITWNLPFFQDVVINGNTGFLANSAEELLGQVDSVMVNQVIPGSMHPTICNVMRTKFSKKNFEENWKNVFNKFDDFVFKG